MANIINTEEIIKDNVTKEDNSELEITVEENKEKVNLIFQNATCIIVSFIYHEELENGNTIETPLHISYMTDHLNVKINQNQEQRKYVELIAMTRYEDAEIDPVISPLMRFLEKYEIYAMEVNLIFNNDINTKLSIYKELANQTYEDRIMFTYDDTRDLNRLIFYTKYRVPEVVKIIEKEKSNESDKDKA